MSKSVDGRLPMVLCEPQLQALKAIGQRLDCTLVDVLFAVFGMAMKGFALLGTLDSLAVLDAQFMGDFLDRTPYSVGYALQIPQRVLRRTFSDGLNDMPVCAGVPLQPSSPDGMALAAFIYSRRWDGEERIVRQFDLDPRIDRTKHPAFDLVVEVTEFDHHVLVECFFCPALVHRHTVARLLFHYACGLRDVESLQTN